MSTGLRILVAVAAVTALLAGANDDCISAAERGPETRHVWDCDSVDDLRGLALERQNVKQGQAAVRWTNHPEVAGFSVPDVPQDWSRFNLLRIWIHSAKPVPARFMILIPSENPDTDGMDYWSYGVRLDFQGWKEFILPIGAKGGTRSPRGWDQVDGLRFAATGWGNVPHPEADLLIDDVRLEYDPPRPGPRMTDEEFFDRLDLSREELRPVRRAVEAGDLESAKSAFLSHMRSREKPKWWLDWRERPSRTEPVEGGSDGWDYFTENIKVDWTGWKEFTLPLEAWRTARKPIGWQHVNSLSFSSTYGNRTPSAETTLVFDVVELVGDESVSLGDFETRGDFDRWRHLQPTSEWVKEGETAGMWSRLPSRPGLNLADVPHDWRPFNALHFWAYSPHATGDVITLTADSDTPNVSAAEEILRHMHGGYHLGDDVDWESNKLDPEEPAFTREWTYGLNRFGQWRTLGRAYWQTGDERYAREWIAQMRDWVEDNPYLLYGTGNSTLTWRTIEAGIRAAGSWPDALAYFLGSPSLQPDDLVTFMKAWIEHADHLMRITLEHPEHGGNWVTMECNGLGHLGILLPECKEAPVWLKTAVDRMTMELDRQVYPDGAQKELTTGYHQVSLRNFVGLYRLARLNEIPMPEEYLQRLERMYAYNLKAMTPEGRLPPLNDAGYTGVVSSLEEGAELFDNDTFRWAATGAAEGEAPDFTSVAFPYAGQYVMRSGWEADDRYLLFESGPFGIGHQHEDKLSMFIYALGRVLLTEAGTYSYDRSKYRRYVLGTWAHNTILVDGQQQHRSGLRETYETEQPLEDLWIHADLFDAA
ncbi:MAG: heparinase II/III family protein, partial [Planctomycetes bacterium]|nr:heparinase II/III family protein [Planctomycetota bacterium]